MVRRRSSVQVRSSAPRRACAPFHGGARFYSLTLYGNVTLLSLAEANLFCNTYTRRACAPNHVGTRRLVFFLQKAYSPFAYGSVSFCNTYSRGEPPQAYSRFTFSGAFVFIHVSYHIRIVPLLNIVPALFSRFAFQRTQFLSEYGIRAGYIHVNTRSRRRKISCFHIKRIKRSRNYHKCHKNAMQTQKNVL